MKKTGLRKLTTPELVARFEKLTLDQEIEMLALESGRYNKLYRQIAAVIDELKHRDGDCRRDLFKLLDHESLHVRFVVTSHCDDLDPARSRPVLREIADCGMQPYALYAGMELYFMERRERGEMP
ncbi:MAG: DUF2019 domain-containing protein [Beijerinckiaceae bacterium]|nr:DUF2019 domain-containing protein [Beijerinckiaceae bacterium]